MPLWACCLWSYFLGRPAQSAPLWGHSSEAPRSLRLLALQASIVPAAAGLLLTPLLMYKLFAPEIKDTPEAPKVRGCSAVLGEGWLTAAHYVLSSLPRRSRTPKVRDCPVVLG